MLWHIQQLFILAIPASYKGVCFCAHGLLHLVPFFFLFLFFFPPPDKRPLWWELQIRIKTYRENLWEVMYQDTYSLCLELMIVASRPKSWINRNQSLCSDMKDACRTACMLYVPTVDLYLSGLLSSAEQFLFCLFFFFSNCCHMELSVSVHIPMLLHIAACEATSWSADHQCGLLTQLWNNTTEINDQSSCWTETS